MRVLFVGGAGYVGGLVLPHLGRRHELRVFDVRKAGADCPQVVGDVTDPAAVAAAVAGVDAVIHCAMGRHRDDDPAPAPVNFDVNVKSVHLVLDAAQRAGVRHAVHISSLSVYRDIASRRLDESVPADAADLYGLTKRLGEQVCAAAVTEWGMSVNVLRIALPTPDDRWPVWAPPWRDEPVVFRAADGTPINALAGSDLARAMAAALEFRDGCQVFTISGDESGRWSTEKARRLLGWAPARTLTQA